MADASYAKRLISEGFTKTPFGYVKDISPNRILLVIDPGKNTTREPGKLNPHPKEIWQCIVHKGYADKSDGELPGSDETLKYVYSGFDGQVHEEFFREGDVFASTLTDETGSALNPRVHGYWHYNASVSNRPIMLEVSRKKE